MPAATYRVTEKAVRLSYPPGRVAHAGDEVDDLPPDSVGWLKRRGFIEHAAAPKPRKKATTKASKGGEG